MEAASLLHPAAPGARSAARPRPRPRLARNRRRRKTGKLRTSRGDRSALHPLHLGHHRRAQGHRARQWRPCGRARVVDGECLWHAARRSLFRRLRRGLGGGPFLHRLRAAAPWLHQPALRGQAGRHAGRRRLLAPDRRARRQRYVHRAHRLPRHQARGPRRHLHPRNTICRASAPCSSPASAPIRRPSNGRKPISKYRSSITGGRPRPAGRSPRIASGSSVCR